MQKRAMLLLSFLAMARDGKARLIKYSEMHWDPHFKSLDIQWCQVKTAKQSSMLFVCDYISYKCEFFHALACYYSLEKGLIHPHPRDGGGYLFPSLVGNM